MGLFREINHAVSGHGHGCGCSDCLETYNGRNARGTDRVLIWRIGAAIVLFAAAWILADTSAVSILLAIASILVSGYDRLIRMFFVSIREKRFGEELLMGLVILAAIAIGRPLEAAAGMILLQTSAWFRSFIAERVRRRLSPLSEDERRIDTVTAGPAPRFEEFLTRFSRLYTPIILLIAVVMAAAVPLFLHTTVREGIYRALILLVIACP